MKNLFFLGALILFLTACTNVNFVSPQPEFTEALSEIPEKYHGIFLIDTDTHTVTIDAIDGISINNDSLVVKERGNYFYVNTKNDSGYYELRIIHLTKSLNYEEITLHAPHIYNRQYTAEEQLKLFNIVREGDEDPVLDNITVNQLSILTNSSSSKINVLRIQ